MGRHKRGSVHHAQPLVPRGRERAHLWNARMVVCGIGLRCSMGAQKQLRAHFWVAQRPQGGYTGWLSLLTCRCAPAPPDARPRGRPPCPPTQAGTGDPHSCPWPGKQPGCMPPRHCCPRHPHRPHLQWDGRRAAAARSRPWQPRRCAAQGACCCCHRASRVQTHCPVKGAPRAAREQAHNLRAGALRSSFMPSSSTHATAAPRSRA